MLSYALISLPQPRAGARRRDDRAAGRNAVGDDVEERPISRPKTPTTAMPKAATQRPGTEVGHGITLPSALKAGLDLDDGALCRRWSTPAKGTWAAPCTGGVCRTGSSWRSRTRATAAAGECRQVRGTSGRSRRVRSASPSCPRCSSAPGRCAAPTGWPRRSRDRWSSCRGEAVVVDRVPDPDGVLADEAQHVVPGCRCT